MWWWHGYGFAFFPALLLLLFGVLLITRIFMFRRCWHMGMGHYGGYGGPWGDRFEAEAVLRRRLANGEISEDEYKRLLDILRK